MKPIQEITLEVTGTAKLVQNEFRGFPSKTCQPVKTKTSSEALEAATARNTEHRVSVSPAAFKGGMATASSRIKGLKKSKFRTSLFVEGRSVPITYEKMEPLIFVSVYNKFFRPSFVNWKARLVIKFDESLSVQTVVDLLNRAGSVGVGEWRPNYGTYQVTRVINDADEISEVRRECSAPLVRDLLIETLKEVNA